MDENDESLLIGSVLQVYHLNRLQEDVAALMISKLKMINEVPSMSFSFVNIDESVSNILYVILQSIVNDAVHLSIHTTVLNLQQLVLNTWRRTYPQHLR